MSIPRTCMKHITVIFVIFFLISFIDVHATNRHINCTVYPGYNNTDDALNFVHVTAVGDNDTVHYLWSSYKLPSVIVARTNSDSELIVDFEKLRTLQIGALKFSNEPLAFTGLTISELWEKSYSSDNAEIDQVSSEVAIGLQFFQWNNITNGSFSCSEIFASLNIESSKSEEALQSNSGVFGVQFSVSGEVQDASNYPHLVYTGNSTQMKLSFDGFHSLLNSSKTRYGLEMVVFSGVSKNCSDTECKAVLEDSVSDEFSPGIFSDINIVSPCTQKDNEKGSFLTWRPVAYISKEPTVANSSDAKMSAHCPQASNGTARSIAELYFTHRASVSANVINVTFGTVGGGFYPKTEYTAWSLMLGTGEPTRSSLSVAAIILLSIGVGGLGLSLLVGSVFLTVRWCRQKDDDLLLSEHGVN